MVKFEYANDEHAIRPYLTPEMLLKIIHNEGFKAPIQSLDFYSEGVGFSKTTLSFEVLDNDNKKISFSPSEEADHYQYPRLYLVNCMIKDDK